MELRQRAHLLVIGGAQADFAQRLAALFEGGLERADIAALPVGLAGGIGQRLELAGGGAPLVLEQPASVGVEADDIAGQRHFGAGGLGLEGAGKRHDFPAALLFGKRALVIARGAAGTVEQGAERSDQQYAKDQGHVAPRRGAPAPVLFIDHFAFRHIPLH